MLTGYDSRYVIVIKAWCWNWSQDMAKPRLTQVFPRMLWAFWKACLHPWPSLGPFSSASRKSRCHCSPPLIWFSVFFPFQLAHQRPYLHRKSHLRFSWGEPWAPNLSLGVWECEPWQAHHRWRAFRLLSLIWLCWAVLDWSKSLLQSLSSLSVCLLQP